MSDVVDHSGMPYRYAHCSCSHCQTEEVVSFDEYAEIKNAEAQEKQKSFEQKSFEQEERIRKLREELAGDVPLLGWSAPQQERPAFQVQNSSNEILISLSHEDLALLVRHLFWQAKQWQLSEEGESANQVTVRNGLGEPVSEPCAESRDAVSDNE